MKPQVFGWLAASLLSVDTALAQTYVVGVEKQSFQPHYWVSDEGQYQGFARDLLDLFARNSGLDIQYLPLPVNQLTRHLLNSSVDFKYPDNPNWAPDLKGDKPIAYSAPVVEYVDGVLVAPKRQGSGVDQLGRLAVVDGWTPWAYEARIEAGQTEVVRSADLGQMIKQAMKQQADGAYYNVVVATYYLDNIRARPGALVFDPKLPHTRGTFNLSSLKHPELVARFDRFLAEHRQEVDALKARYQVEANLDSEFLGMEQWKIDFLKRQKEKANP
ncbi:substrate-binding periplasmic protein [Pseudomonas sp. GCM10022186]|uniref:substrate-binding periplasmic protein n=1 Tax=Pseudomonas sp. GCM10022186 TaxID=3252650 RepID=UPI00360EB850